MSHCTATSDDALRTTVSACGNERLPRGSDEGEKIAGLPPAMPCLLESPSYSSEVSHSSAADEWTIEAFVMGDGIPLTNGLSLKKSIFYATAKANGGREHYHPIDFASLELFVHGSAAVTLQTKGLDKSKAKAKISPCIVSALEKTRSNDEDRRKMQFRSALASYCKANPGVAVVIGGPGSRSYAPLLNPFIRRDVPPMKVKSEEGECVLSSIMNGIYCLLGTDAADSARNILHKKNMTFSYLAPVGIAVHALRMHVQGLKPKGKNLQELKNGFKSFLLDKVGSLSHGVWLIRLVQAHVVDHCVTIDGASGLIYDSTGEYPVTLSPKTLKLCGGGEAKHPHIAELRQLVLALPKSLK